MLNFSSRNVIFSRLIAPIEWILLKNHGEGGSSPCLCIGIQVSSNTVHKNRLVCLSSDFSHRYALNKGESWTNWGLKLVLWIHKLGNNGSSPIPEITNLKCLMGSCPPANFILPNEMLVGRAIAYGLELLGKNR